GLTVARGVATREPAASPRPLGTADTAFGLGVLGAWCRSEPGANVVLSPSSLASGLGMAYLGAGGGTATAMAAVLHLPAAGPALPTRASYLNAVATGYRAGVAKVPLQKDPAQAAARIDQAIATATRGH